MEKRSTAIIASGVAVALLGALLVFAYARRVETRAGGGESAQAWAAARDIGAGTKGNDAAQALRKVRVPRSILPETAITAPGDLGTRIAVRPINAGELITTTQFGTAAATPKSGLEIPPGLTALSVNVPVPQGVARYPQPGDLVNIYATLKDGKSPQPVVTKLIHSNVQVLSNTSASSAKVGPSGGEVTLTLALSPAEAERLVYAKENGSIWFALVRPGDGPSTTSGQTPATIVR